MDNKGQREEEKTVKYIRRKTIFSFAVLIAGFCLAFAAWRWLNNQPKDDGVLKPLRVVLNTNEKINKVFFSEKHIAKKYPKEKAAKKVRVNGDIGMGETFDPKTWKLSVLNNANKPGIMLGMDDIMSLPKKEIIFDFKCIEGWDQVTHWAGASFFDFLVKYKLGTHSGKAPDKDHPEDWYKYVGLMTPDSAYYVGIDMKSIMHEQTILCYEMNNKPLPFDQGYPLRLIITVKYGIKSLKRIGYMYFSDERPADYWFENGYDYDAAL